MKGNRGHVIKSFALARLAVQGFDVAQGMRETQSRHSDFVRGQGIEHESIVGIRTVGNRDFPDTARDVCELRNRRGCIAHTHISTLRRRRQPDVMHAASVTLIISAKTNQ